MPTASQGWRPFIESTTFGGRSGRSTASRRTTGIGSGLVAANLRPVQRPLPTRLSPISARVPMTGPGIKSGSRRQG